MPHKRYRGLPLLSPSAKFNLEHNGIADVCELIEVVIEMHFYPGLSAPEEGPDEAPFS
jgi:hypothetical protein